MVSVKLCFRNALTHEGSNYRSYRRAQSTGRKRLAAPHVTPDVLQSPE